MGETNIYKAIMAAVQEKYPRAVIRKRHGGVFGVAGDADLYGCLPTGRHFEIEVKQPGESATILQRKRLADWAAAGALTGVAHTVEEALEILKGAPDER